MVTGTEVVSVGQTLVTVTTFTRIIDNNWQTNYFQSFLNIDMAWALVCLNDNLPAIHVTLVCKYAVHGLARQGKVGWGETITVDGGEVLKYFLHL